ncbi:hypothetical protein [Sphingomonas sp.]|uniref:hypothetical protein n=1 Tax=Sphingomonas sp. TaxID=28214 RepID=UPI001B21A8F7|nr:hypothetical protein [Sphingomonas sp.]MBO9713651.1 hypothetical protein [Sphingomonas sp.]
MLLLLGVAGTLGMRPWGVVRTDGLFDDGYYLVSHGRRLLKCGAFALANAAVVIALSRPAVAARRRLLCWIVLVGTAMVLIGGIMAETDWRPPRGGISAFDTKAMLALVTRDRFGQALSAFGALVAMLGWLLRAAGWVARYRRP